MVLESIDLSDTAQKRATRKLLFAGVACIFLAFVSAAVVIGVVLQQNEKERIPNSFDKLDQTSPQIIPSIPTETTSSIYLVPSLSEIPGTSSVSKTFSEIYAMTASILSKEPVLTLIDAKTSDYGYSSSYIPVTNTIQHGSLPFRSTTPVFLSLLSRYSALDSDVTTTDHSLLQSPSSLPISMTENLSTPFSTSVKEVGTQSHYHDIDLISSYSMPMLASTYSKLQLQFSTNLQTIKKDISDIQSSIFSQNLNIIDSTSTTDFILGELSTTVSHDYTVMSHDHIMSHDQSVYTDSKTMQYTTADFGVASIFQTNQSEKVTSVSVNQSGDILFTAYSITRSIGSSDWRVWETTSAVTLNSTPSFNNSKFLSSYLFPIQTAYEMSSVIVNSAFTNFFPTTWTQSTPSHTVSSTVFPGCSSTEFRCNSGQCVPVNNRCDRIVNCLDMSDEINCTSCIGFQCASGLCLWSWNLQCNKRVDCLDLSDEIGCNFGLSYRRCNNGMSVPEYKWCDNIDNCFDNSDEINCNCSFMETACTDGHCIRVEWICDGHVDCVFGTDEVNCSTCAPDQYICSDYSCINSTQICDGIPHCPGADDEISCYHLKQDAALSIQLKGDNFTVCSTYWNSGISDYICQLLGQRNSTRTSYNSDIYNRTRYLELESPLTDYRYLLQHMSNKSSCTTNKTVSIACMPRDCGERSADIMSPYVAGGDLASLGHWPWMVSLSYLGKPYCSGTLISQEWVVTAGHCVAIPGSHNYTENPQYTEVLLGSVKRLKNQGISRRADRIVHHPKLKWTGIGPIYYDVAMIHLDKPVTFTDFILPICMPKPDFASLSSCYIAGWGYISPGQDVTVEDLREAKLHVFTDRECQLNTVPLEQDVDTNITYCAGYKFGVISGCQGDSGSPMMCQDYTGKWTLAGVMSSGAASCGTFTNTANRFTKISAMLDWIKYIIPS